MKTNQPTASLRWAKILRRVRRLEEICCHSTKKPSTNAGVKNSEKSKIIIIIIIIIECSKLAQKE